MKVYLILLLIFCTALTACSADKYRHVYGDFKITFAEDEMVNDYARQKCQLKGGVYDAVSNTTYIPFSAGTVGKKSACSPFIRSYSHTTGQWSDSVEIYPSPVEPDSHNYPSILIDSDGYLHVFHTFHANYEILHAVSKNPRDTSEWNISFISGTEKATYGAAFQSSTGDFYLMVRIRLDSENGADYEPEYILKSTDRGETWEHIKIIDPSPIQDNWGTVYTKAVHYNSAPEGLHITFAVHQYHNENMNEHFYAFYNFSTGRFSSVDGTDYGICLDQAELSGNLKLFDLGGTEKFYNIRMAIGLDDSGIPHICWNQRDSSNNQYMQWAKWNGDSWDISKITEMNDVSPAGVEYIENSEFRIYATKWGSRTYRYIFDSLSNSLVESSLILHTINNINRGFSQIIFIENAHPEILGYFIEGDGSPWTSPKPNGILITFGLETP